MEIILTDVIIFLINIAMKNIPLKYINIIIIHKYEKSSHKKYKEEVRKKNDWIFKKYKK